jgi:hypothetical protein
MLAEDLIFWLLFGIFSFSFEIYKSSFWHRQKLL